MKKIFSLISLLALAGVAFAQGPKGEPQIPVYPTLEDENSFSMILVPDPQSYTKFAANQPLFDLQTAWIEQNIDRLNINATRRNLMSVVSKNSFAQLLLTGT